MSNKTRNLARNLLAMMALGASMGSVPGVSAAEKTKETKKTEATQAKAAAPAAKGGLDMKSMGIGAVPGFLAGIVGTYGTMKWLGGAGSGPMLKDKKPQFDNSIILGIMGKRITDANAQLLATTGCRATLLAIAGNSNLLKQGTGGNGTADAGHLWIEDGKVVAAASLSAATDKNYLPENGLAMAADKLVEMKEIDFGGATKPADLSDANKAAAQNYVAALSLVGGDVSMLNALKGSGLKVTFVKGGANNADFELKATSAAEDKEVKLTGKVGKPETYKFEVAK